jgi:hypothetical protein
LVLNYIHGLPLFLSNPWFGWFRLLVVFDFVFQWFLWVAVIFL